MPVPKPNADEKQADFISRCMGDKAMQEYEQEQRAAICYQTWKDKDKAKATDDPVLSEVQNGLVRVAVAYTGNFLQGEKNFTISAKDLEDMKKNVGQREIPLDYEHLSATQAAPGWSRAAGWIKAADQIEDFGDGRKVLWAWAEFTPACLAAIRQKEFRYFSPEIHWRDTDEQGKSIGTRLAAGAITNRPFLKDLPPIEIDAAQYPQLLESVALTEWKRLIDTQQVHVDADINTKGTKTMKQYKLKKVADGDHKGKVGIFEGDSMIGLCEDDAMVKKMQEDEPDKKEPDADDAETMKAKKMIEAKQAEASCFAEFAKAKPGDTITLAEKFVEQGKLSMAGYLRVQKIERLIDGAIAKGKALPKQRVSLFTMAIADYDAAVAFLNDAQVIVDLKTHGIEGSGEDNNGSAAQELETVVVSYMKENKVDRIVALRAITRKNPQLWERATNEQPVMTGKDAKD